MDRDVLYELVRKLEDDKGFTQEGAILRSFIRQNTKENKTAALFKPKEIND